MAKYRIGGDVGHGGNDPGAINGSRKESADACKLGIAVMNYVEKQTNNEILMYLNRTNEKTMSLSERSNWANKEKFDILISFHRDSASASARGASVHVYNGNMNKNSGKLANKVADKLCLILPGRSSKIQEHNFHILRETSMTAILIETGFISNDIDNKIFDTKFNEIVAAIGDGIIGYLEIKKTPNKPIEKPPINKPNNSKALWELCISGQLIKDLQSELNKQCNAKLKVDGYFGDSTLNKCIIVKKGAKGNITKVIQERLQQLNYNIGKYGVDGSFGQSTHDAVISFQKNKKLSSDGIVGKNTWKALMLK